MARFAHSLVIIRIPRIATLIDRYDVIKHFSGRRDAFLFAGYTQGVLLQV
jgi:hypothetical protein